MSSIYLHLPLTKCLLILKCDSVILESFSSYLLLVYKIVVIPSLTSKSFTVILLMLIKTIEYSCQTTHFIPAIAYFLITTVPIHSKSCQLTLYRSHFMP